MTNIWKEDMQGTMEACSWEQEAYKVGLRQSP